MTRMLGLDLGVEGVWWSPRSSKPLRPDLVGLGGFDSHTLPPSVARSTRAGWISIWIIFLTLIATPRGLAAQSVEGARAGVSRPDSAHTLPALEFGDSIGELPPISPRRAFLYSLAIPGAGQARLDRAYAGAVFVLVEIASLALVDRASEDLRIARAFRDDSMPATYQIDPVTGVATLDTLGRPIVATWARSRYTDAWVRTRRLHREDWMALLIFNHLFSGADAFVAAQLWDLPAKVGLRQTPNGPGISASLSFGAPPRR